MEDSEEKGYTIQDKRYLHMSEAEKAKLREEAATEKAGSSSGAAEAAEKAAAAGPGSDSQESLLPEITFASFLVSLSSSAFISLGQMADPATGKTEQNLPLAKQTIDLLAMLREKTRNNLSSEEENLFDHLLYDLRMAYIKEAK